MRGLRALGLLICLLWVPLAAPAHAGFTLAKPAGSKVEATPLTGCELEEARGGVRVFNIAPGSPAGRAGFVSGDLLTSVNGADVFGETSLRRAIYAQNSWKVVVVRDGREFTAAITAADLRPPATADAQAPAPVRWAMLPTPPGASGAKAATAAVAAARAPMGPRIALVIGNSAYDASLGRLTNPANDAQAMAAALRATGFEVEILTDADQKTMKRAIARLGDRVNRAGKGATGLFFYAGHGIQARGVNYLVPVGAVMESEADVDLEAVPADAVLRQLDTAGAQTSIVILDACRNLPLARAYRDATRGLARMDAPNGSFIAYSTAPNGVAADGTGVNSPFVTALTRELQTPGQSIEATFRKVRVAVLEATKGRQTPWDSSSLLRDFVFAP